MMMLEDRFFEQEWVQELSNEDFRMLLYLLHFASKKTGIVELNMRQINFCANTGKQYTKDDVLSKFGNMIQMIPGRDNTAIFASYVATNWAKNGKPIDTKRNPLFKSVVAELANFGLTIGDLNAMSGKVVEVLDDAQPVSVIRDEMKPNCSSCKTEAKLSEASMIESDALELFDAFWKSYPGPRKTDKRKCCDKFCRILKNSKDPVRMFNRIMKGVDDWKATADWLKDGGQYVCAPLVWLNNERWDAEIKKGNANGNQRGVASKTSANYQSSEASDIF